MYYDDAKPTTFPLKVVNEIDYTGDPACPHCGDPNHEETHVNVETLQTPKVLGDVFACSFCKLPYLVIEVPEIDAKELDEITLNWQLH